MQSLGPPGMYSRQPLLGLQFCGVGIARPPSLDEPARPQLALLGGASSRLPLALGGKDVCKGACRATFPGNRKAGQAKAKWPTPKMDAGVAGRAGQGAAGNNNTGHSTVQ